MSVSPSSRTASVRCAVYTRKSSEEGLDMAFNSLDAQRESGLDYIKSQKHQGWVAVTTAYDDGGYSGGSTDRPGLQRLLSDISKGCIDIVLVYKVDRLSRSLADFAQLMQLFDQHNVSFVSVTQQFNTTTSMGRLTLNMLLSFAQFEREVAGERIRDKILATKQKGVWVCGQPPLGYRLPNTSDADYTPGDRTLRIVEAEAKLIQRIYAGYLKSGSLSELAAQLNKAGHTTRKWTSSRGIEHGGHQLTAPYLHRVLCHPIYIGRITHERARFKSDSIPNDGWRGLHAPIIDQPTWNRVRARMGTIERDARVKWTHSHLLKGKLRTFEDFAMSPGSVPRPVSKKAGTTDNAKRMVLYYVSQKAIRHGYRSCPIRTINARHLDDLVRGIIGEFLAQRHNLPLAGYEQDELNRIIRDVVQKVVLAPDWLTVEIDRAAVSELVKSTREDKGQHRGLNGTEAATSPLPRCPLTPQIDESGPNIVLRFQTRIKLHDGKRLILSEDGMDLCVPTTADGRPIPREHLVRALGMAFAWHRELLRTGETVESLARRCNLTDARIHELLSLTRLSPMILKAVVTGTASPTLSLRELLQAAKCMGWDKQVQRLNSAL